MSSKVQDLTPDGYTRYHIIVDVLKKLAKKSEKITILDVGGSSNYMEQQLNESGLGFDLTVIDVLPKPKGLKAKYIKADATKMPFPDGHFDFVITTDVLEHIPQNKKDAFVTECLRVAKKNCIIAGPFETEGVTKAEELTNDLNIMLFGSGQNWLEEHFENGKPILKQVQKIIENKGYDYVVFGSQNLAVWTLNTHLNLLHAKYGLPAKNFIAANRFYAENIEKMNEFQEPTYRKYIVVSKEKTAATRVTEEYVKTLTMAQPDYEKYVEYLHKLLELPALQAAATLKQTKNLDKELNGLRAQIKQKEESIVELSGANQQLQEQLREVELVIRIKSKLKRGLRMITKGGKRG